MSRVTKTLEPSPQINSDQMAFPWMSFAEDSPAKTSHTQGGGQAWKARDQDYGAKSPAWLASYDRNTSSWKMSQHSLVEGLDEFLETWPRSGTTRNGIAYQLPPLALRTDGIESGSWPTPRASSAMATNFTQNTLIRTRGNLEEAVAQRMWPTPRASPNENRQTKLTPSQKAGKHGINLAAAVHLWPTPVSRMWKDSGCPSEFNRNEIPLAALVGGALNPTWVEWLMGFPLGWTVSKVWEMRSSRKSQKSLVEQS